MMPYRENTVPEPEPVAPRIVSYRENAAPEPEPVRRPPPIWQQDGFGTVMLAMIIYAVIPITLILASVLK